MSGRGWHRGRRPTVEERPRLDVQRLSKDKLVTPSPTLTLSLAYSFSTGSKMRILNRLGLLIFSYSVSNTGEDVCYPVETEWTSCTYGGSRPWFLCPAVGCGRRCRFLYLGERYFVCRSCAGLSYRSSQVRRNISAMANHAGLNGPNETEPIRKLFYRLARMRNPERKASLERRIERLLELKQEDNRRLMSLCRM